MILAQNPPSLAPQQEYSLRQTSLSGVDLDFSSYSPSSSSIATTQSHLGSPFTPDLDSVFLEDSSSFLSKFHSSLPVPFGDHCSATSEQQDQQSIEQQSHGDESLMNRTGDFYTPNRTQQTAPRSASSQASHQSAKDHQQGQWYQTHLAPPSRPRFHGQLAGHKRNNSGSTITSTGPSSPFTPVVQPYAQIHDPEAAAQHYPSPLSGDFDLTPQQSHVFGKTNFTENFFGSHFAGQQQPHQTFRNTHHANGESTLPYQVMVRNAMMSQDSNASNGGVPTLQRFPTSEFERDYRATLDSRASIPKLDRSLSDIYQDELYNPNNLATTMPTSQPQQPQNMPVSHRDVFSERLQAATSEHLSARSSTPATTLSRDRSPFQPNSRFADDDVSSIRAGSSPASGLGSVAQLRERQKAEADAVAAWSQQKRQSYEEPKTISPKDAVIENIDADVDTFPLFPQQDNTHRFSLPQDPQYSMQHDPHFGGEVPRRGSGPMTMQQRQRHHSQQYQMFPQNFGQQFASQESNPEFPANLTSMESTRSDAHSTPTSSQHSESSTRASSDLPVQRPEHTTANSGSYACTHPGCTARFDGPGRLQRHRNMTHGALNSQSSPIHASHARSRSAGSPAGNPAQAALAAGEFGDNDQTGGLTGAALAARNSQAGPHKCERINPSTGQPCNSIFSRPYDLTRHEETIHNARKQKVRCQYCTEEKTFSRADALTRHMRVVHPEMEFNGKRVRRS